MTEILYKSLILLLAVASTAGADEAMALNGRKIMQEVYNRHQQYPYVYEEQSMIMTGRDGKRDTRKAHRYSRVEKDGTAKFLLVFDYPREINGVAVLAIRSPSGQMTKSVYLPAFAEEMIRNSSKNKYGNFLGTDFSVENIIGEKLDDYQYVRRQDRIIQSMKYFIIDVYRRDDDVRASIPVRRHFVRADIYFIIRTDYYDNQGRLHKRQSYYDLKSVDGDMWRADMILMQDVKIHHQTLLKVTRRKFSHDYVPEEMFTANWLYKNHPYIPPENREDSDAMEENSSASLENEDRLSQLDGGEIVQP